MFVKYLFILTDILLKLGIRFIFSKTRNNENRNLKKKLKILYFFHFAV